MRMIRNTNLCKLLLIFMLMLSLVFFTKESLADETSDLLTCGAAVIGGAAIGTALGVGGAAAVTAIEGATGTEALFPLLAGTGGAAASAVEGCVDSALNDVTQAFTDLWGDVSNWF